jgi:hypothetical protein
MGLDPQTVDKLINLARSSTEVRLKDLPGEKRRLLVNKPDGTHDFITLEPPPRNHVVNDLDSLMALSGDESSIWVSRTAVVLLFRDADRFDRATFPLSYAPQTQKLIDIEKAGSPPMKQADLIFMLRTVFSDCLVHAGDIINVLRRVKFRLGSQGESVVDHTKRSIGRSLEAEITGTGTIPEYLILEVPIWNECGGTRKIEVALEPDAATETFKFVPLPGKIGDAIDDAVMYLKESVAEDANTTTGKIYIGTP